MTPHQRRTFDVAVLTLVEACVLAILFHVSGPLRWAPVLVCGLLLPGAALASRMGLEDVAMFLALVVVTSLAVTTLTAMALVWTRWWHPLAIEGVLALAFSIVLIVDVVRITRQVPRLSPSDGGEVWS